MAAPRVAVFQRRQRAQSVVHQQGRADGNNKGNRLQRSPYSELNERAARCEQRYDGENREKKNAYHEDENR